MRQGVILSIIVLTIFCAPIFGYDWFTNPGDGSPENPYQISTPEQLMSIGSNADLLDKHFELTHDIVFDPNNNLAHVFSRALIAPDIDTSNSSSFDQIPFTGTFNGNGYSIRNLKILNDSVYENYLGLFGYVTGNSPNVTVISNLSIISAGIGKHRFGGYLGTLVGKFENGLIDNCHAVSVSVKGEHDLGGLVGYSTGSNFQNCSVSGQVTGSGFYCGGLVGQNDGGISNCRTNCTVLSDSSMVGGLIGDHRSGNIINCSAKGIVKGTSNVGGLVGVLDSGECSKSFFTGSISCERNSGGFVGYSHGTIIDCYAITHINLESAYQPEYIGGFVGRNSNGLIDGCGSWSQIECDSSCEPSRLGGFVGYHGGGLISNCCSQGEMRTDNENINSIGGFAGRSYGETITKCYTTVRQIHKQVKPNRFYDVEAFVGFSNTSGFSGSFFDIQRSNVIYGRAYPLRTSQMEVARNFAEVGWDFVGEEENGTEDIWRVDEGDYPRLAWLPKATVPSILNMTLQDAQARIESLGMTIGDVRYHYSDSVPAETVTVQSLQPGQNATYGREVHLWVSSGQPCPYSGGEGTDQNPCQIASVDDLLLLAHMKHDYDKNFILVNDINLAPDIIGREAFSGALISPSSSIGNEWYQEGDFRGVFDGNNHRLSNLTIGVSGQSDYVGLFGTTYSAYIHDLNLENIQYSCISAQDEFDYSGGLVGYCVASEISDCTVSGDIAANQGSSRLGGVSGATIYSLLRGCGTSVNIEGENVIGGLVGANDGDISHSYSTGSISGLGYIGGLVGDNRGDISYSYTAGSVSGSKSVGGVVGINLTGSITCCYSQCVVTGNSEDPYWGRSVGCLIGSQGSRFLENLNPITHCYATGQVYSNFPVYGIIGRSGRLTNIISSYWDIDVIGMESEIYGTGLTTQQMKQQASFINWDFENVWWIDEGNDYPRLRWELNAAPVADAGADQTVFAWIDGYTMVQLDGTASYDEDGNALEYYWYDANELIATGAEPNVVLGVGEHEIALTVNDGVEDSEPNSCVVTVIEPFETVVRMLPGMISLKSQRPELIGRIEFAGEAMPVLDPNEPMLLLVGGAEIEAQKQKLLYSEEELAWYLVGFFDSAAVAENLTSGTEAKLTLVSRFDSGQWVYGTDIVKVK